MKGYVPMALILLVFVVGGCAAKMTHEEIQRQAGTVKTADGINEDEAVFLAQDYMIRNGLDQEHALHDITEVLRLENIWTVRFGGDSFDHFSESRYERSSPPITLQVDAQNGTVGVFLFN